MNMTKQHGALLQKYLFYSIRADLAAILSLIRTWHGSNCLTYLILFSVLNFTPKNVLLWSQKAKIPSLPFLKVETIDPPFGQRELEGFLRGGM